MAFRDGVRVFKFRIKQTFSFENIVLLVTVGLVVMQLLSYVATTWFACSTIQLAQIAAKEKVTGFCVAPSYFGPYILVMVAGIIIVGVFSLLRRAHLMGEVSRGEVALMIIATVILVSVMVLLNKTTMFGPVLFKDATAQLMSIVGIR
jgi:hypothetical protein